MGIYLRSIIEIFFLSCFASLLTEFVSWLLVYRTDSYQKLKAKIEQTQKKLDQRREGSSTIDRQRSSEKKKERLESVLKEQNQAMSWAKTKITLVLSVIMISFVVTLNQYYEGAVVAKLPFEPFYPISNIAHRNLSGTDLTDCAFIFLYVMLSMGLRPNLQLMLGTKPQKGMGSGMLGGLIPEPPK